MNEVAKYLKNLSNSVKYASIDSFKDIAPNTSTLAMSLTELTSSINRDRVKTDNVNKKLSERIKSSKPYSALELFKKSIKEDIKSGQFYNKDRKSQVTSKLLGFDEPDFLSANLNFDDENDDFNISVGDQLISASISESNFASAEAISGMIAQTTEYAVEAANTNTMLMYSQAMEANKSLHKGLQTINENIAHIVTFHNTVSRTHTDNAILYYKTSTETLGKILDVLNQIHNIEVSRYPGENKKSGSRSEKIGDLTVGGVPDLSKYLGNVKQNFLNNYGHMFGLTDTSSISPITTMLFDIASSPLSEIPKALATKAIKSTIGDSLNRLDETISNVFSSVIMRVNNLAKESFSKKAMVFTDLFGIDNNLKTKLNTSKYNKEAMQWNGIAQKTLVEVIPTYLRQISAAVTGTSEKIYNYDKGKFVDAETLKKDFDNIKQMEIKYGMDDIYRAMRTQSSKVKMTAGERESFNNDMMKFFEYFVDNAKPFNLNSTIQGFTSDKKFGINRNDYNKLSELFDGIDELSLSSVKSRTQAKHMVEEYVRRVQDELFDLSGGEISKEDIAKFTNHSINKISGKRIKDDSYERESEISNLNIDPENFELIKQLFKSMPKHVQGAFDKNVMRIRDEITGKMERIESDPNSVFYNLFNDSDVGAVKGKGALFGSLLETRDTYSYSIFDYLRGIYNALLSGPTPGSKKRGKGPNGPRGIGAPGTGLSQQDVQYINNTTSDVSTGRKSYSDIIGTDTLDAVLNDTATSVDSSPNLLDRLMNNKIGNKLQPFIASMQDFVDKPAKMLSTIMDTVDTRLYQVFYGIDGQSIDGQPVNGVFDVMVHEMKSTFNNLNDLLQEKVFEPLKDKFNEMGGLRGAYESIMKKMGIDPYDNILIKTKDKIFGSKRRGVEGYMTPIFNQFKQDFKDIRDYSLNVAKESYSDIGSKLGIINPNTDVIKGQMDLLNESFMDKLIGNKVKYGPSLKRVRSDAELKYKMDMKRKGINVVERANKKVKEEKGVDENQLDLFSQFDSDEQSAIKTAAKESGLEPSSVAQLADNIEKYAKGSKRINKTQIAIVHEGEEILTKEQAKARANGEEEEDDERTFTQRMFDTLRGGIDNVSEAMFGFKAGKEPDKQTMTKDFMYSFKNIAKDYIPQIGSGALWGALGGVLLGPFGLVGNALLGSAIGSSASLLTRSKEMQDLVFGEYDEETQSRKGGLLSGKWLDAAEKAFPHIKKGALTGAVTAMMPFVPGGPITGLMLGSVLGFANRNGAITDALFGEDGIIGKDAVKIVKKVLPSAALGAIGGAMLGPFGIVGNIMLGSATGIYAQSDQFKDILFGEYGILKDIDQAKMRKAFPNVAAGAVAGMFMGPFGLLGNVMLGSALGFATTTDKFKEMLIGKDVNGKREGGLFGAVRNTINSLMGKPTKKGTVQTIRDIIAKHLPLTFRETTEPYIREFAYQSVRFGKAVAKKIADMMENSIMGKIMKSINDHIIKPIGNTLIKKVLPKVAMLGGAALLAPIKLLQGGAKSIMKKQMEEGRGDYLKQSTLEKLLGMNPRRFKAAENYLDPDKKRKEEKAARKRRKKDKRTPEDVAKDTDLKVEKTNTILEKILESIDRIINPETNKENHNEPNTNGAPEQVTPDNINEPISAAASYASSKVRTPKLNKKQQKQHLERSKNIRDFILKAADDVYQMSYIDTITQDPNEREFIRNEILNIRRKRAEQWRNDQQDKTPEFDPQTQPGSFADNVNKMSKAANPSEFGMPTEHGVIRYDIDDSGQQIPIVDPVYLKQKEDEDREDKFQEAAINFFNKDNNGPKEKDGKDLSDELLKKVVDTLNPFNGGNGGGGNNGGLLGGLLGGGGLLGKIVPLLAPFLLSSYYGLKGRVDEKLFFGTGKTAVKLVDILSSSFKGIKENIDNIINKGAEIGGKVKDRVKDLYDKIFKKGGTTEDVAESTAKNIDDIVGVTAKNVDEIPYTNPNLLGYSDDVAESTGKNLDDIMRNAVDVDYKPEESFVDKIINKFKSGTGKGAKEAVPEVLDDGTILVKNMDDIAGNKNIAQKIASHSQEMVTKFIDSSKKAIDNMVNIIVKGLPDLASKTDDIAKIINKLLDPKLLLDNAKIMGKIAAGLGKTALSVATVLFSDGVGFVWGACTGSTIKETANLFQVSQERVDTPMRMISGVMKAILNISYFFVIDILNEISVILFEMDFIRYLATSLYGLFMGQESMSSLQAEQEAFYQRFLEAKQIEPDLNLSDYNDAVNQGVFDSITTWLFGGKVYNERTNQVEVQDNVIERSKEKINENIESMKDTVSKAIAKSSDVILNKFIPMAKKGIKNMVGIITKMVPDLAEKSKDVLKIIEKLIDPEMLMDAAIMSKIAAGMGKTTISAVTFMFSDVVTGTWGFVSGFNDDEAANLFQVSKERVDIPMRMISAAIKSILNVSYFFVVDIMNEVSKIAFDLDFIKYLAVKLYELIVSDDKFASLEAEQDAFLKKFQAAKDIDPTLTFEKFNDVVNMSLIDKASTWIFGGDTYNEKTGQIEKKDNVLKRASNKVKSWFGMGKEPEKDYNKIAYNGINYGDMGSHLETNRTGYLASQDGPTMSAMGKGAPKWGGSKDETFFSQNDPQWSDMSFNAPGDSEKQTIGDSGCGPTVAAMLANSYDQQKSNPVEAAKYALKNGYKERNGGTTIDFFNSYLGNKGIDTSVYKPSSTDELARQLDNGPVVLMGQSKGGNTPFGSKYPHYVMATGMDSNGKLIVNDPYETSPTSVNARDTLKSTITGIATASTRKNINQPYNLPSGLGFGGFTDVDGNKISAVTVLKDITKAFNVMGEHIFGKSTSELESIGTDVESMYYDSNSSLEYDESEAIRIINNEFIRRNSKLKNSDIGGQIVRAAKVYNLDPYLMAAISIMETGGTSKNLVVNNNPAGLMDGDTGSTKPYKFNTLYDGYLCQGKTLHRMIYTEGRTTVAKIGDAYCPVGADNDPNGTNVYWVPQVTQIYRKMVGKDPFMLPSKNSMYIGKSSTAIEKMIALGSSKLGAPYVWGEPEYGTIPDINMNKFDCSGLVSWAGYHSGFKFPNRRETSKTFYSTVTDKVSENNLTRGDLGFRLDNGVPGHVGIYLGGNRWLQTRKEGEGVIIGQDKQWTHFGRIKDKYRPVEPEPSDTTKVVADFNKAQREKAGVSQYDPNFIEAAAFGKGDTIPRRKKNDYEAIINSRTSEPKKPAQPSQSVNTQSIQSSRPSGYGKEEAKPSVSEKLIGAIIELLVKIVDNTSHLSMLIDIIGNDTNIDKSTKDQIKNVANSQAKERAKAINTIRESIDKTNGRDLEQLTRMLKAIAAQ